MSYYGCRLYVLYRFLPLVILAEMKHHIRRQRSRKSGSERVTPSHIFFTIEVGTEEMIS